ncbi:hypothetical protein NDU88_003548, partial [Pleurodeles waltl]
MLGWHQRPLRARPAPVSDRRRPGWATSLYSTILGPSNLNADHQQRGLGSSKST